VRDDSAFVGLDPDQARIFADQLEEVVADISPLRRELLMIRADPKHQALARASADEVAAWSDEVGRLITLLRSKADLMDSFQLTPTSPIPRTNAAGVDTPAAKTIGRGVTLPGNGLRGVGGVAVKSSAGNGSAPVGKTVPRIFLGRNAPTEKRKASDRKDEQVCDPKKPTSILCVPQRGKGSSLQNEVRKPLVKRDVGLSLVPGLDGAVTVASAPGVRVSNNGVAVGPLGPVELRRPNPGPIAAALLAAAAGALGALGVKLFAEAGEDDKDEKGPETSAGSGAKGVPKPTPNFEAPTNAPQNPPTDLKPGNNVRVMGPTEQYPYGYWVETNAGGQPIDPSTGKPPSNVTKTQSRARTHVPLPPK
jgi:hypothetical protein